MLASWVGHLACAVDVETTGRLAGWHEIIQIAAVPLNQHFDPHPERPFFYINMAPDHPERISKESERIHKIKLEDLAGCVSQDRGADLFEEWFVNLGMMVDKRLIPLAHNWGFERGHLISWLGMDSFDKIWQGHPRDTIGVAGFINDLLVWHGRKHPFGYLNLPSLCERFDINLHNAHDALADALATAELYRNFIQFLGSRTD